MMSIMQKSTRQMWNQERSAEGLWQELCSAVAELFDQMQEGMYTSVWTLVVFLCDQK